MNINLALKKQPLQSIAVGTENNYQGGTFLWDEDKLDNGGSNTPNKTSYFGFRKSSTNITDSNQVSSQIQIHKQESLTSNDYTTDNSPTFNDLGDVSKKQTSQNYQSDIALNSNLVKNTMKVEEDNIERGQTICSEALDQILPENRIQNIKMKNGKNMFKQGTQDYQKLKAQLKGAGKNQSQLAHAKKMALCSKSLQSQNSQRSNATNATSQGCNRNLTSMNDQSGNNSSFGVVQNKKQVFKNPRISKQEMQNNENNIQHPQESSIISESLNENEVIEGNIIEKALIRRQQSNGYQNELQKNVHFINNQNLIPAPSSIKSKKTKAMQISPQQQKLKQQNLQEKSKDVCNLISETVQNITDMVKCESELPDHSDLFIQGHALNADQIEALDQNLLELSMTQNHNQQYTDLCEPSNNYSGQQENFENSQILGPNDSIHSIEKIRKINSLGVIDDDYHTDIEIKRLEQYSPEVNRLNREEMRDITNRPNILDSKSINISNNNMNIIEDSESHNQVNLSAFIGDQQFKIDDELKEELKKLQNISSKNKIQKNGIKGEKPKCMKDAQEFNFTFNQSENPVNQYINQTQTEPASKQMNRMKNIPKKSTRNMCQQIQLFSPQQQKNGIYDNENISAQKSSIGGSERPMKFPPRMETDAKSVQCNRPKKMKKQSNFTEAQSHLGVQYGSNRREMVGPFSEQNRDDELSCRTTPTAILEQMNINHQPTHFQLHIDTGETAKGGFDDDLKTDEFQRLQSENCQYDPNMYNIFQNNIKNNHILSIGLKPSTCQNSDYKDKNKDFMSFKSQPGNNGFMQPVQNQNSELMNNNSHQPYRHKKSVSPDKKMLESHKFQDDIRQLQCINQQQSLKLPNIMQVGRKDAFLPQIIQKSTQNEMQDNNNIFNPSRRLGTRGKRQQFHNNNQQIGDNMTQFNDCESISKQSSQYKQQNRYIEQPQDKINERQGPQTEQKKIKKSRFQNKNQNQNFDCAVSVFSQGYQDDILNQSSDMINMKNGSVDLNYNYDTNLQSTQMNVIQKSSHHEQRQKSMQINNNLAYDHLNRISCVSNSAFPSDRMSNYHNHPSSIQQSLSIQQELPQQQHNEAGGIVIQGHRDIKSSSRLPQAFRIFRNNQAKMKSIISDQQHQQTLNIQQQ